MTSCDWQISIQKPTERNQYLLESGLWSDCNFIVGQESEQQTFKGHKLLLASSSPVFEAMFFGAMAEKNDPISIKDVQPKAFKILLEYLYTCKIQLTSSKLARNVYYCGEKYILPYLKDECINYLMSNLSPKDACMTYEFAMLFEEESRLLNKCLQIINTCTSTVLVDITWEEVKLPTLLKVLDQDVLQIQSEVELFIAVERWAKAECQRQCLDPTNEEYLRFVIGNALSKIRFLSLTNKEFIKNIEGSPLLTINEAYAILMNILWSEILEANEILYQSRKKQHMPKGFSTNKNKRMQPSKSKAANTSQFPYRS